MNLKTTCYKFSIYARQQMSVASAHLIILRRIMAAEASSDGRDIISKLDVDELQRTHTMN